MAARPPSKAAAVLRVLGALLCVGGGALMVASEIVVLARWTAIEQAQYATCFPEANPIFVANVTIIGPQHDLCVVPAVLALLVIGARVLIGKTPGIAPPAAVLLPLGGALFIYLGPLIGAAPYGHGQVCDIYVSGSYNLLFPVGLLIGLVGSIVLSRTTRYRPLRLEDA